MFRENSTSFDGDIIDIVLVIYVGCNKSVPVRTHEGSFTEKGDERVERVNVTENLIVGADQKGEFYMKLLLKRRTRRKLKNREWRTIEPI